MRLPRPHLPGRRRWLALGAVGAVVFLALATAVFWGDLVQSMLDPKVPFQTYQPPPAPDFATRAGWRLMPPNPQVAEPGDPSADVFFVSPTVYDGGREWNAPVADAKADKLFRQVMAPNYVGPFVRVGRIFAPRYRQASLYSLMTLREDAREARRFAYADVADAFRWYIAHANNGRPFIVVGVEQGGFLASRLVAEEIARDPTVRNRLVVAYLDQTVEPADRLPIPACGGRAQTGCLAAWTRIYEGDDPRARIVLDRALVWAANGEVENLGGRPALCFNPLLGAVTDQPASARLHLGAANAKGLEWDARPAFLARQVSARCVGGVLRVSRPKSSALKASGSWIERRRAPEFNLFYADLEADAKTRVAAMLTPRP